MTEHNHNPEQLNLVQPGSLLKPGPLGRVVRLVLGLVCLYAVSQLTLYRGNIIQTPLTELDNLLLMFIAPLLILNPVINIGYGVDWNRKPLLVSLAVLFMLGMISRLVYGTPDTALLGSVLWAWLVYFYVYVGFSFILASLIATPGCEMRAIPDLYGKLAKKPAQEHHCPAFLAKVDAWEQQRKQHLFKAELENKNWKP